MPYTSMPAWPNFSDEEVSDLAYFVTTFSPDFSNKERVPQPVQLPSPPGATKESAEQGKKIFADTGCVKCHGTLGRGDGPSAPTLMDDWSHPIRAADLSQSWTFRGGSSREDIFRTMSTGLNGTPMPSFSDSLTPEQRWAITDYIVSLSGTSIPATATSSSSSTSRIPSTSPKARRVSPPRRPLAFRSSGRSRNPVREFHPPATSVVVQAIYDADSIAVLVRWHDRTAEKAGTNGPSLQVPPEEEEEAAPAAAGRRRTGRSESVRRRGSSAGTRRATEGRGKSVRGRSGASCEGVRVLGCCCGPASVAGADGPPQAIFHFRRRPELGGSLVLRSGPPQSAAIHRQGQRRHRSQRHRRRDGRRELRPGRVVGHLQASASPHLRRADSRPGEFTPIAFSVWDGFSRERGNRRGLSQWYSLYVEPEGVPSAAGPMIRTALFILVLELAVIGLVRWRKRCGRQQNRPWARDAEKTCQFPTPNSQLPSAWRLEVGNWTSMDVA